MDWILCGGGGIDGAATDASKMPRLFAGLLRLLLRSRLAKRGNDDGDFIHKAVELRVDGVDMTAYYLKSTDPAYLDGLRHLAYKNAIAIFRFSLRSQHGAGRSGETRAEFDGDQEMDRCHGSSRRLSSARLCRRIASGVTLQQGADWAVETMKAATDYSGKKGIMLGVEDHNGVTQRADVCLEIMQRVNSPYAGINLDVTNFIPTATQDVYAQIAACIPYATNTHIRDRFEYNKNPVDLDRVWKLFANAGFKGYMSAEYEGPDSDTGVPKLIAQIRTLCDKYSTV